MYVSIILGVIFLACVASLFNDGLWSNAVRLVSVILAALLAMNYFEPLATYLDTQLPTFTFVWDFLSLWGLFTIFSIILKLLTDSLSKVKVKFLKIVDQIGGYVFAFWIGWVMVCFTSATLHTAPLSRNFAGFPVNQDERMFMGLGPDRQWLGFTQKQSMGVFGHSPANTEEYVFDPQAQYMLNYHYRRARLEAKNEKNDTIRINRNESWSSD